MRRFVALAAMFLAGFSAAGALRKPPPPAPPIVPQPAPVVREVVLVDRYGRFVASLPAISQLPNEDGTVRVFAYPP